MEKKLNIFITGGNKGIGYHLLEQIIKSKKVSIQNLIWSVRSKEKGEVSLSSINKLISSLNIENKPENLSYIIGDIQNENDITTFSKFFSQSKIQLDLLIQNAGIYHRTKDNTQHIIDSTLNTNYYGPRKLFNLFHNESILKPNSKVVFVSSGLGTFHLIEHNQELYESLSKFQDQDFKEEVLDEAVEKYKKEILNPEFKDNWPQNAYGTSKLFLSLYVSLYSRKYTDYHWMSVCPGWCLTDMTKGMPAPRTAEDGARDIWRAINYYENKKYSGKFFGSGELRSII